MKLNTAYNVYYGQITWTYYDVVYAYSLRDFTREGDKLINMEGKEGRRDIVNRHKRVYI